MAQALTCCLRHQNIIWSNVDQSSVRYYRLFQVLNMITICIYIHGKGHQYSKRYWIKNLILNTKPISRSQRNYFLYARLKNGTYYAVAMSVRPSVRLSVRPSVRPSVRVFRTFLQHALRYQFETWYMHSVGGTTCRVWVASQLGQFDLVYSQK